MRLRGRGRWLVLAGLIGAAAGAATGWWNFGQINYEARGAVRLGTVQASGTGDDPAGTLRMDQVIERELAELRRWAGTPQEEHRLTIEVQRAEEAETRLDVTARATHPDTATTAIAAVMAGYHGSTPLNQDATDAQAWQAAQTHLAELRAEVAAGRSRLAETRAAMGTDDQASASATLPMAENDPAWTNAVWTLNEAKRAHNLVTQRRAALDELPVPEPEQVAALDPEAAGWWGRVLGLNRQLAEAVWPPNPDMADRLRERLELETQLQARAKDTRLVPLGETGLTFRAVRISETQTQVEQLAQALATAEQRVAELRPRLSAWRNLNADVQRLEADLALREAAVAQLDPGSGVRLIDADVLTDEAAVYHDTRPMAAAWAGAAGLGAGVLLCGFVCVLDPRVRRSRDGGLVGSTLPVLGTVPVADDTPTGASVTSKETSEGGGEPSMDVASIQSVRAVLESKMRPVGDGRIPGGAFAVTGIASGSGTTSVAVGLAVSMALSGSRVLLIDLAWLQKPAGTGTDDDAARQGLGVDGVIEELGYLDDEDREAIALAQHDDEIDTGFGAILRGVSLRRSVVQTRVAGLSVLSAMGRAERLRAEWAGRVSSRWLGKLLEVARRGGYTATILDAGSATGSVEGMLGCAAADGTVVVVSGDQTQADYDKAVNRLRLVGATIVGTVLNRSDAKRFGGRSNASPTRRATPGVTTGSGIFAAAIEARAGGRASGGSGLVSAPLPKVEDEPPAKSPAPPDPVPAKAQAETPIPDGVDPFAEPPAEVRPTPTRQPPRSSSRTDLPDKPSPEQIVADTFSTPSQAAENPDQTPASASAEAEPTPESTPEVHVADDVMDQLVDHAIRSAAQRPRKPQAAPPHDESP